jgi:uncharacterized protein
VDDPSVRLELAKLCEHWVKSPLRALEWADAGTGERPEQARKRVERLTRKAHRSPQVPLGGVEQTAPAKRGGLR